MARSGLHHQIYVRWSNRLVVVCKYPRIQHAYFSFQWYCDSHRTSPSKRYAKVSFDMAILQLVSSVGRPQCSGSRLGGRLPTNCPIGSWLLKVLSNVWKTIKFQRWRNVLILLTNNPISLCSKIGFNDESLLANINVWFATWIPVT